MSKRPSLSELRNRIKQKQDGGGGKKNNYGDIFPFWQMDYGDEVRIRILADKNEENPDVFSVDKLTHRLTVNGKNKNIPCLKNYGENCPICDLSFRYYKNEGDDSENGKKYYRKKDTLLRVLVLECPFKADDEEETSYEGRVMTAQFSYQLMQKINQEIAKTTDGLESDPWDIENGYDFIIRKEKQGKYANYQVGSSFARNPSPIPKKYRQAVEDGMVDLSTLIPANPGLEAVQALLNAHLSGDDIDESDDDSEDMPAASRTAQKQSKPHVDEDEDDDLKALIQKTAKASKPAVERDEDLDDVDDEDDDDELLARLRRSAQERKGK